MGEMVLRYFDHVFPLTLESLPTPYFRSGDATAAVKAAELNANPRALDKVLRQQHYLLASWTQTDTKLNYRRFFQRRDFGRLSQSRGPTSVQRHSIALIPKMDPKRLGWMDCVRGPSRQDDAIPARYLARFRSLAPNAWIVVEKILQPGESLSAAWPVEGSYGLRFSEPGCGTVHRPTWRASAYRTLTPRSLANRRIMPRSSSRKNAGFWRSHAHGGGGALDPDFCPNCRKEQGIRKLLPGPSFPM